MRSTKNLKFQRDRCLSEFSTFGIGGPIDYLLEVSTEQEVEEALCFCREEKMAFLVVGKGSNCLFPDEGFRGLVLLNRLHGCRWEGDFVEVGSGYSFSLLGVQSAKRGLSGLEFAAAIPASVGGALFMNAGAHGQETSTSLSSVSYLHADGRRQEFAREELSFGYRLSPFQALAGVILGAKFDLTASSAVRKTQLEILNQRGKEQPVKEKSAGCIFRNPKEGAAGFFIDQCGLKGIAIGGAQVSEVHANFIVNRGGATAHEVKELIQLIQKRVYEKTGIHLEAEVRIF